MPEGVPIVFRANADDSALVPGDPVAILSRYGYAMEGSHRRQLTGLRESALFDFYEGTVASAPRNEQDGYVVDARLVAALRWEIPTQLAWEPSRRTVSPRATPRGSAAYPPHPGSYLAAYRPSRATMLLFQELFFLEVEQQADAGRLAERLATYERVIAIMGGSAPQPALADEALATLARMLDPVELLRLVRGCPGGPEVALERLRGAES